MTTAGRFRGICATAAAVAALAVFTACGTTGTPAETPSPNSTATVSLTPTQKSVPGAITPIPGSGPQNSATAPGKPSPVLTVVPGHGGTG